MNTLNYILLVLCVVLVVSLGFVTYTRDRVRDYETPSPSDELTRLREREKELIGILDEQRRSTEQLVVIHENELNTANARITTRIAELETDNIRRRQELELQFAQRKREEARLTTARSRTALVAKIGEHFAPLLEGFPYNFKDCRHVGEIFDFLVFDGLEEGRIRKIVFLEVKTKVSGGRVTNKRERMLRDAIRRGDVAYDVFVPDTNGAKAIETDGLLDGGDSDRDV